MYNSNRANRTKAIAGAIRARENQEDPNRKEEEPIPYSDRPGFPATAIPSKFVAPFTYAPWRRYLGATEHIILHDAHGTAFCVKCEKTMEELMTCSGTLKEAEANAKHAADVAAKLREKEQNKNTQ